MSQYKRLTVIIVCLFIFLTMYDFVSNGSIRPETQSLVLTLLGMIAISLTITVAIAYTRRASPSSSNKTKAFARPISSAATETAETQQTKFESAPSAPPQHDSTLSAEILTATTTSKTTIPETTTRSATTMLKPHPWIDRETLQKIYLQSNRLPLPQKYALVLLEAPNFKELISILGYRQSDQLMLQVAEQLNQQLSATPGAIALLNHPEPHPTATLNLPANQLPTTHSLPYDLNEPHPSNHLASDPGIYISHLDYCQFAFFLDCTGRDDQAVGRTRMILNALKNSEFADILPMYFNPCAGIAFSCPDPIDYYELLRQSQIAVSQASNNHHRIERYQQTLEPHATEKTLLMGQLRQAIDIDSLAMRYQPQVSLDHKYIIGIEALVHWNHPELGLLPAHKFIPIAESIGLIQNLTEWTIDQVIKDASLALSVMPELNIAINISPYSLLQPDFSFYLHDKLNQEDIPTESITLEIQENVILKNNPMINRTIKDLKQNKFNFAIDDFGTGYGSLKHLRDSPISEIKINPIFIKELEKHKTDQAIVKSIINMCHNIGSTVVAEGIETSQTFELLKTFNCDAGQGALFSKPVKISELLEQLASSSNLYNPPVHSSSHV